MPSRNRQTRAAARLLYDTASASASVIGARVCAFSDPGRSHSPWLRAEAERMGKEKIAAAGRGVAAAGAELALLPWRALQIASHPAAWTPSGWLSAWIAQSELWIGVGNAALRPARSIAVRNRSRLARRVP